MKNIHVIPTDKPSRLRYNLSNVLVVTKELYRDYGKEVNQNIYITSDEEIKEGDWFYDLDTKYVKIKQSWENSHLDFNGKKIILTTDQDLIADGVQSIPDEFLEWFVKNPSCEFVEWSSEKIEGSFDGEDWKFNYGTVIPQEEPKQEIWKDIPNYEGLYQVSNFGNVKSLERYVKGKIENRLQKENILSKRLVGNLGNQYYAVTLCNNKDRKQIKVSVLVAMAFLNHTPNGYVGFTVDHIDNNPLNNNVDNLQVITKRENSSKDRKGISKYTGVTFNKKSNKWRSQIWINGKNKTLGSFDDELEAHRAYQKELQQHLKS
jgi:hypothetical protein